MDVPVFIDEPCDRPTRRPVVHFIAGKRPWLYTLKSGEEVAYTRRGGGMAMHLSHPERLRLKALCTELTGRVLPFHDGPVEHHATRDVKVFDCPECRVALDQAMAAGRAEQRKNGVLLPTLDVREAGGAT